MDKYLFFLKRALIIILMMLGYGNLFAYDFEVGGIYYNKISDNEVKVVGNNLGDFATLILPEIITINNFTYSVTAIGNSAFQGRIFNGSLTIPSSVKTIGNSAFANCRFDRSNLIIPNSVTSIGNSAFEYCKDFGLVTISNSVMSIGDYAFLECSGLTSVTIGNSVTSIGNYAFYGCSGLTSVTIGNSVTSIGGDAFRGCSSLTSVTIPNSVTSIGNDAFYGCSGLTSVTIGNSVTSIGGDAFRGCSSLTSVTIPNSVTSIGSYAFDGCSGLTSVNISDLEAWYKISFNGYYSNPLYYAHHLYLNGEEVKDLVIPNSVTSIGIYAFSGCSGLTSVTIGNSVTSIGGYAFEGCSGLTSVTIPNSVTGIGNHAFYGCSGLTSVTIPNSVTSIEYGAFGYCSGLTSVTIPNSVTSIGYGAFSYCSGLTSVTIGNSVTSIGGDAFRGCSSLTSVTIPNSVTSIGSYAFYGCSGLTSVNISDLEAWCKISFSSDYNNNYTSNPLSYAHHLFLNGEEVKDLVIPSSVTSIGNYAFYGCSGLTSVTIPNSVTSIGTQTFEGCSGLTSVNISDLEAWCKISFKGSGSNPLFYAHHLYLNGEEVKDLVIPNSVTSIGYMAFYGCSYLTSVTIPNSVTSIGAYVFAECNNLISVYSKIESPFTLFITVFSSTLKVLYIPQGTKSKYVEKGWAQFFSEVIEEEDTAPNTHSLSITSSGPGSATYNGTTIRNQTRSFTVNEGTSATVSFTPDSGQRIASVKVNNTDVTASVANYQYTISSIAADTKLEVTFEEIVNALVNEDVNYSVVSQDDKTVRVSAGKYGQVLTVPESFVKNGVTWTVIGIETDALKDNADLAAIVWNPNAAFTATVSNPNLLLYVKDAQYAPGAVKNVVVNGTANSITLVDAESGNNFFCPQQFIVRNISYIHHYGMATGIGESRGWETISLPFDVQTVTHATKGSIVPFKKWTSGDTEHPFWLYELNGTGWTEAQSIKAYTPYIISMPNNSKYKSQFQLAGNVTFAASNVTVGKTEDLHTATYSGRTFTPTFSMRENGEGLYALNVNNDFISDNSGMTEGSRFVLNMRKVHPFEAYMTAASQARQFFEVFETGTEELDKLNVQQLDYCYDLAGRKIVNSKSPNSKMPKGVYIMNGRKIIIK